MGSLYEINGTTGQAKLILLQGTTLPGSGTNGQLFWKTDTQQFYIHNGTSFVLKTEQFHVWTGTQAAYDALGSYDSNTVYFVNP